MDAIRFFFGERTALGYFVCGTLEQGGSFQLMCLRKVVYGVERERERERESEREKRMVNKAPLKLTAGTGDGC